MTNTTVRTRRRPQQKYIYLGLVSGAEGQMPVCISKKRTTAKKRAKDFAIHRFNTNARVRPFVRMIPVSRTDGDFSITSIRSPETNKWRIVVVTPASEVEQKVATEKLQLV